MPFFRNALFDEVIPVSPKPVQCGFAGSGFGCDGSDKRS